MANMSITSDVLTLEEVADYLRISRETVERQATSGQIPARRIEDSWRFLKQAIDNWLSAQDSRQVLLSHAGVFADDETLAELRASIYAARGRSEVEMLPDNAHS